MRLMIRNYNRHEGLKLLYETGSRRLLPPAVRLEKSFGLTAEMWLSMQMAFDLATAYKNARRMRVKIFAVVDQGS